jgi:hypothetical protein
MFEAIAKAASIPKFIKSAEPFTEPPKRLHTIIVGGSHLSELAGLFPGYALEATIIVPSTLSSDKREKEFSDAVDFEDQNPKICRGAGMARDLSGFDSGSADLLIVCASDPAIRSEFLSHAWRVIKEFGKIIVFTPSELPIHQLANFGISNPVYYATEGFYVGTLRRAGSLYARN